MHFDNVLFIVYIIYTHEAITVSVSQCTYLPVIIMHVYNNLTSAYVHMISTEPLMEWILYNYTIFQIKIRHLVIYELFILQ